MDKGGYSAYDYASNCAGRGGGGLRCWGCESGGGSGSGGSSG